jgi:iron complex outermembrane recepter protein
MSALSPAVGASLRIGSRAHVYANLSTAFETPTTTELANRPSGAGGFNPELDPQRSVSLEAGARGDLGAALQWEAALYHARVRDALVPFEVAGAPGRQYFRNAGRVTHRGGELGARWALTRAVRLEGAYSYTDARFDAYTVGSSSYAGNRLPGVAPHRVDLSARWSREAGPFVALDGRAASETTVDDAGSARSPGYAVLDLRAGTVGLRAGGVEASVYGGLSNLLDRRYNASVVINAFGRRYFEPAPGRTVFLGASLQRRPRR